MNSRPSYFFSRLTHNTQVVTEKREEDTARSRLQAELQRLRRKMEEEQVAAAVRARQATEAVTAASKGAAAAGQVCCLP